MRRFIAGFAAALVLVVVPVALAAGGDSTVKGNLTVNGSANVGGDVQARSVQAISGVISNFATMFAGVSRSPRFEATSGGSGYTWTDGSGIVTARVVFSQCAAPPTLALPPPVLMLCNNAGNGELWFETASGVWTRLTP